MAAFTAASSVTSATEARRVLIAELAGGGVELCLVDADEVDLRALGDEQARGGEPDPALAAGDQRDLVLHPSHGRLLVVGRSTARGARDHPLARARLQSRSRGIPVAGSASPGLSVRPCSP